jgi:hypothetical protein
MYCRFNRCTIFDMCSKLVKAIEAYEKAITSCNAKLGIHLNLAVLHF